MAEEFDYDEEDSREERRRKRRDQPRFGSFVTIAAAILMLFGAASRVGKMPEVPALFGIDQAQERHLLQDGRMQTFVTVGSMPNIPETLHPAGGSNRPGAMPPVRPEVDPNEFLNGGRSAMSLTAPDTRSSGPQLPLPSNRDDREFFRPPATETMRPPVDNALRPAENVSGGGTYVVANGDTWVKIAKRTLGDASRWQELLRANPEARNGLKVGMRLTVP